MYTRPFTHWDGMILAGNIHLELKQANKATYCSVVILIVNLSMAYLNFR